MNKVKSLEDLKRVREEALKKRDAKIVSGQKQVIVGMGTVGIAAGARETLKAFLDFFEKENLSDIVVRQTGNIGWDSYEPIVQIITSDIEKVTYGKVTPDVSVEEHMSSSMLCTMSWSLRVCLTKFKYWRLHA
jgi:NADP-reducing hydrogenase subunit HndB